MEMNNGNHSLHTSLNVLGCEWSALQKQDLSKPVFLMRAASTYAQNGLGSTFTADEMDLKLENERRLQEMREHGKQFLQEREQHSARNEGAADLLARFHSMQWMRQTHTDVTAGPSQENRPVDNGKAKLVPVKHSKDEYFAGTRQQKKTRRPKKTHPKTEVVKLEEVVPSPSERILPAGYQAPIPNAWAGRKGSDLFDPRKLSLTLYGPSDPDELLERAVQESLITWQQEQDRIVNMFSCRPSEDQVVTTSVLPPAPEAANVKRNLPNELVDAWTNDDGLSVGTGGCGDGHWTQNVWNNNRSDGCGEDRLTQMQCSDKLNGGKLVNYGANLPENSSYCGRNRPGKNLQGSYRTTNGRGNFYQRHNVLDSGASGDRQCLENFPGALHDQTKEKPRTDAGDGLHHEHTGQSLRRSQICEKKNYRNVRTNNTNFYKNVTEKCEVGLTKREGKKKEELESLGFSRTRSEQFAQRETMRRRQVQLTKDCTGLRVTALNEQLEESAPKGQFGLQKGCFRQQGAKEQRVSFSEPHVLQSKDERSGSVVSDSDPDPWLEDNEIQERTQTVSCLRSTIQPGVDHEPQQSSPLEEIRELKSQWSSPTSLEKCTVRRCAETIQDDQHSSQLEVEKTVVKKFDDLQTADVTKKEENTTPEESSEKDESVSPGPGEVSFSTDVSTVQMKKLREDIEILDERVKMLTSALEQSCSMNAALKTQCESKADSMSQLEGKPLDEEATPPLSEETTNPSSTHFPFQNVSPLLSHPMVHTPMTPSVHPMLHPAMQPLSQSFMMNSATQSNQPQPQAIQPAAHLLVQLQAHSQAQQVSHAQAQPQSPSTQPQAHFQAHPQAHLQTQSEAHQQSLPESLPQTQSQAHPHANLQTQPVHHPMAHSMMHPLMHPLMHSLVRPQVFPQAYAQANPQAHPLTNPQVHPQATTQTHPQADSLTHLQPDTQSHLQPNAQIHPQANSQPYHQMSMQTYPQMNLDTFLQANPQAYPETNSQTNSPEHSQVNTQALPQTNPLAFPQTSQQSHLCPPTHLQTEQQNNTGPHSDAPLSTDLPASSPGESQRQSPPDLPGHPQTQQPSQQWQQHTGLQPPPSMSAEALLAHLQGQIPAAAGNQAMSAQVAQYLAHQQQQQHLVLQGAAVAGCPPQSLLHHNWMGLRAPLPYTASNWASQMHLSASFAAAHGAPSMQNAAFSSAANMANPGALPKHANSGIETSGNNAPATADHSSADDSPEDGSPADHAPAGHVPLTAIPHAMSGFPASNSMQENQACSSANTAPSSNQIGGVVPNSALHMHWIAQMNAFQQQQQQRMAQLASAIPNMHSIPMQTLLQQASLNGAGLSSQSGPTAAKMAMPYEGDWIISPADEARLGQGLQMMPQGNCDSTNASPENRHLHGISNFPNPSPSGSAHTPGLPVTAVLNAQPPSRMAGVKTQHLDSQVPDSDSLDFTDFNPAVPPPQVIVNPAGATDAFHGMHPPAAQLVMPKGLQSNTGSHPEKPRGRGRLR